MSSNSPILKALLVSCSLTACASRADHGSRPPFPAGAESTETATSALIGGKPNASVNVTQGIPNSKIESETAAVTLDSPPGTTLGHAVAYNSADRTPGHIMPSGSTYQICEGFSAAELSYTLNSSPVMAGANFTALRFPTPPTIAMLVGDPGIVAEDVGAAWRVFVSSLAISTSRWGTASCLALGLQPHPDQVCVMNATIPKNGGAATLGTPWCSNTGFDFDGTALQVTTTNAGQNVYVSSMDLLTDTAHVWQVGQSSELPNPFPNASIVDHVIMPRSQASLSLESSYVTVVAPDNKGNFQIGRLNISKTNPQWGTTQVAAPGCACNGNQAVTIAGGQVLRELGYTVDTWPAFGLDFMWLFYPTTNSAGFFQEQGIQCEFLDVVNVSCTSEPAVATPSNSNAYLPTVAFNNFGGTGTGWLSYWSDATSPTGNLQMVMTQIVQPNLFNPPTGVVNFPLNGVTETPCGVPSENGGYWGDYDGFTIANSLSFSPSLFRYLTDSTSGTCDGGVPAHISVAVGWGLL